MTNIRNDETYLASFWDWTFLNQCFAPTNIRVSDIDGIVERNGRFLFIETKHPGEKIPQGQAILHDQLLRTGRFSVLMIWGNPNHPVRFQLRENGKTVEEEGSTDVIAAIVRGWFERANRY